MAKFVIDLWLDGYESEEEMADGCLKFIRDALNFSGSGVTVRELTKWENHLLEVYKEKDAAFEKLSKAVKEQK